jgi:3',5'-nucleoside bisphosphate phosphatase
MIDLHMHTKYSDGTDEAPEILTKAQNKNLNCISITDHNTVDFYKAIENINISKYYSGRIIVGVELNTKILGVPIEILGYNFDYDLMREKLPNLYISAMERNKIEYTRLIKKCEEFGLHFSEEEINSYDYTCFSSKYIHKLITSNLENKKFFDEDAWNNSNIFYRKYMSNPSGQFYVEMDDIVPDFESASNLIKECGGKVFLPHIYEYKDNSTKILDYILANYKIDGIECYYTTFTKEQSNYLLNICEEHKFLISGGSDYHGKNKPNVDIGIGFGNLSIPDDIIKNLFI